MGVSLQPPEDVVARILDDASILDPRTVIVRDRRDAITTCKSVAWQLLESKYPNPVTPSEMEEALSEIDYGQNAKED